MLIVLHHNVHAEQVAAEAQRHGVTEGNPSSRTRRTSAPATTLFRSKAVRLQTVLCASVALFLGLLPLIPNSAIAAADAPARLDPAFEAKLTDIDARAGKIQDYVARFEQHKYTALLRKPLVSTGTVRVLGPVVRWDTEKPDPAVLHADGKEVKLYYPRQKLVEIYPIDKRMSDLAASPLPRLATLRENFTFEAMTPDQIKADAGELANGPDRVAVRLKPTGDFLRQHIDEIRVLLDQKSAFMLCVVTVDKEGDRTVIRFSDARLNTGLKSADVAFAPPADARVSRPLEAGGSK